MARNRRPRGLRQRHFHGYPNPAIPCPTAHCNDATERTCRVGQWTRCVGGDGQRNLFTLVAVLRPQCHRRRWRPTHRGIRIGAGPHWIFKLEDGTRIELEIFAVKGEPTTCLSWKLLGPRRDVRLFVRPFLSGRDYHSLHKSNPAFRFDAEVKSDRVSWQPYNDVPGVTALTNGNYSHQLNWYYNFLYEGERVVAVG